MQNLIRLNELKPANIARARKEQKKAMKADLQLAKQEIGKKYKKDRQNADIAMQVKTKDKVQKKTKGCFKRGETVATVFGR